MMANQQQPNVTFRVSREDAQGIRTVEEREVTGCTQDELLALLCAPWDQVAEPVQRSSTDLIEEFGAAVSRRLRDLEVVIRKRDDETRGAALVIGFRTAKPERKRTPRSEALPVLGRLQIQVAGDHEDGDIGLAGERCRLEVRNQGLLVVSRGNLYCNLVLDIGPAIKFGLTEGVQ